MLIALLTLLATAASAAGAPVAPGRILIGNWAGDGFAVGADEDRATVQSGCSHGRTTAPITLDRNGGFITRGYFNPAHSGYRLGDIAPRDRPATFTGKVSGNMLVFTLAFDGSSKTLPHTLIRGGSIKFPKCPS